MELDGGTGRHLVEHSVAFVVVAEVDGGEARGGVVPWSGGRRMVVRDPR